MDMELYSIFLGYLGLLFSKVRIKSLVSGYSCALYKYDTKLLREKERRDSNIPKHFINMLWDICLFLS